MRMSELDSRAVVKPAHERIDPYWAGVWNVSSTAAWDSRATVERLVRQGLTQPPKWLERSAREYQLACAQGRWRGDLLPGLAAVNQFRTLTTEQLAAITGQSRWTTPRGPYWSTLMGTGLIQSGSLVGHFRKGSVPDLLRVASGSDVDQLLPMLSREQAVGLLGGHPWKNTVTADRHSVLASEFLLRLAEWGDTDLVLGERLTEANMLVPDLGAGATRAGDGMIVRADGLRIVIELTASISTNFDGKAEKWADTLRRERGLAVLFIAAPHPDGRSITKQLTTHVSRAAREQGGSLHRVPERMMVCNWQDFFPDHHEVNESFFVLRARRPSGSNFLDPWESVDVLDPFDLEFDPSMSRRPEGWEHALAENAQLLSGIPHWQRELSAERFPNPLHDGSPTGGAEETDIDWG